MEAARKRAYRYVIYYAMLEIRVNVPCSAFGHVKWWSLGFWRRLLRRHQRNMALADCMHNLAQFSAEDFEHFNERQFWATYDRYEQRYGFDDLNLRNVFNDACSGKR
jgi:hypothetical protein